ncbi:MAG: hypothetical protein PHD95_00555 [Candidatus ainarchaeum sp.]|nr:hypothetical protein [Candidatus ainarchaeum sp.]
MLRRPVKRRNYRQMIAANRASKNFAKLVLGRETILPSELAKVRVIKDSGQSLDLKAAKNLKSETLFSYTLPAIGGRYSSFLGRVRRESGNQLIFILTHKNNGSVYRRLAIPIRREFARGARRPSMLIEVKLLPGKIGVKKRKTIKLP